MDTYVYVWIKPLHWEEPAEALALCERVGAEEFSAEDRVPGSYILVEKRPGAAIKEMLAGCTNTELYGITACLGPTGVAVEIYLFSARPGRETRWASDEASSRALSVATDDEYERLWRVGG